MTEKAVVTECQYQIEKVRAIPPTIKKRQKLKAGILWMRQLFPKTPATKSSGGVACIYIRT